VRLRGTFPLPLHHHLLLRQVDPFRMYAAAHCNGVVLYSNSDVKRWLSEVRGKDMPGNFSWSYKR
jgi:hypothetical protein